MAAAVTKKVAESVVLSAEARDRLIGFEAAHTSDRPLGNAVTPAVLETLAGQVDVMLALTGAPATIALEDLEQAINVIAPRIVVPMHYWHPPGVLKIKTGRTVSAALPRSKSHLHGRNVHHD